MAKYDKVPRKKKKAVKKAAGLQGKSVPKKEVVSLANKEAQKKKRDAATLRRFNANKEYLKSLNIPTNIITKSTSTKETKKRAERYLAEQGKTERQIRQANLVARKINRLIDAGFTKQEAEKYVGSFWRPASEKTLDSIIAEKAPPAGTNFTFTAKEHLYIGAAEVRGGFHPENFTHLSNAELASQIHDRVNEADSNPDDSNSLYCVYQVYTGNKDDMNHVAKTFYKRGYNMSPKHTKLDSKQYNKLTISNSWNEHDFYSMVLNVINQMKNEDVRPFISRMREYCDSNGLPFMKNLDKY